MDEEILKAFGALYETATQARDADATMRLWADDPEITMGGSEETERAVGPAAVRTLVEGIAASPASLSFRWDERRVQVAGDVAW